LAKGLSKATQLLCSLREALKHFGAPRYATQNIYTSRLLLRLLCLSRRLRPGRRDYFGCDNQSQILDGAASTAANGAAAVLELRRRAAKRPDFGVRDVVDRLAGCHGVYVGVKSPHRSRRLAQARGYAQLEKRGDGRRSSGTRESLRSGHVDERPERQRHIPALEELYQRKSGVRRSLVFPGVVSSEDRSSAAGAAHPPREKAAR
jgi:hypothetical protein